MPHCQVGTENGGPIEIYYEDHGSGQPVVPVAQPGTPRHTRRSATALA